MRPLVIGDQQRAEIRNLVAFAEIAEHWFKPGITPAPGSDRRHVVHIPFGFRCVFSFTHHQGQLWRHLSVSVPAEGMFPSPESCVVLGREFGFTAKDEELSIERRMTDGWVIRTDQNDHCIQLAQPVEHQTIGEN